MKDEPTAARAATTERRSTYLLAVPATLLLLPAAVSAGLDPVRIMFLLLMLGTGAASLWHGHASREPRERRHASQSERPSRDAVLNDLRKAAAATPHASKIRVPDPVEWKQDRQLRRKAPEASSRNACRIEELPPKICGERWALAREYHSRLSVLSTSPPLHTCNEFLTADECSALVSAASPVLVAVRARVLGCYCETCVVAKAFSPSVRSLAACSIAYHSQSTTGHGEGGGGSDGARTSRSCLLDRRRAECRVVLEKVAALSGAPVSQLEDPQVAYYDRGQFYEPHCDGPDLHDPQARRAPEPQPGLLGLPVCP